MFFPSETVRFLRAAFGVVSILLTAILSLFPAAAQAAPFWYDSNWAYRKSITIKPGQVSGTQLNFPVLIDSTSIDLLTNAQADGDDILFTDGNGQSKLAHEIEKYDSGTGRLVAWVKVPSAYSGKVIYMYYGNAAALNQENKTGVWDPNFKLVQHLRESAGTHFDSTTNGNDGTPLNGVVQGATGKIDGADSFDGVNDYIDNGPSASLKLGLTDSITVEAWVNPALDGTNDAIAGNEWDNAGYHLRVNSLNRGRFIIIDSGSIYKYSDTSVLTAGWHHIVGTWNGVNVTTYRDGVLDSAPGSAGILTDITSVLNFWIGNIPGSALPSGPFNGPIDEVRVSNTARSADWIDAEYKNQNDPGNFYALGSQETLPVTGLNTSALLMLAISALAAGVIIARRRPSMSV